jgi:hypothetical protein
MNSYPLMTRMLRSVLERERAALASDEERVTRLKEELTGATRDCQSRREAVAELEGWLAQPGAA